MPPGRNGGSACATRKRSPDDSAENFVQIESTYRKGFEAALDLPNRGKGYTEAENYLKMHFPDMWDAREFRAGYERGHRHAQSPLSQREKSARASPLTEFV